MKVQVKAGRYSFDKETKKVKIEKSGGRISVFRNSENETHFSWVNTETKIEEIDRIVFANDAIFEKVVGRKNTYLLRFNDDDDRYFFWLQEEKDGETIIAEIMKIINFVEPEGSSQMEVEGEKASQIQQIPRVDPQPKPSADQGSAHPATKPGINIHSVLERINLHKKPLIESLGDIFTAGTLPGLVPTLTSEEKQELTSYLPESQKTVDDIPTHIRSPQFAQALDVLSQALNSENVLPLFLELRLDPTYLQRYFGIEAFLRALIAKESKPTQSQ